MSQRTRGDRVLAGTRVAAALIATVLTGGAVLLLGWPDNTEQMWAWTIHPRMTPLVIGAGFASGIYFFGRAIFIRRWHNLAMGFLPVALFTWFMAAASILHWQRFNHGHPASWVWAATYAITPFLVPLLWLFNRGQDSGAPDPDDAIVPLWIRRTMGVAGIGGLTVAVWIFARPDLAVAAWPWSLTPLTARVIAGWIALPGALGLAVARESRWSAVRLSLQTGAIAAALTLIGIARAWDDFDPSNPLTWVYLAYIGLPALALPVLSIAMDRRRAPGDEAPRPGLAAVGRLSPSAAELET